MEKGLTMVAHAINVGNDGVYATVEMWDDNRGGIVVQPGAEIKPEMLSAGNGNGIHSDYINYHVYKQCLEIRYC
jgi:hypothetical protein